MICTECKCEIPKDEWFDNFAKEVGKCKECVQERIKKGFAELFKIPDKQQGLISQEVLHLATTAPISKFVWDKLYLNSYERNFLVEFVSDEVLLEQCQRHINNITTNYTSTYEGAILHKLFPEVCKRLREKTKAT